MPNCRARNNVITLQSHFSATDSIHTTYTRYGDLSTITSNPESGRKFNFTNIDIEKQLSKLTSLQKMLETNGLTELPSKLNNEKLHNHVVSYLSLALSIIIVICWLIWNIKSRKTSERPVEIRNQSTPQPSPRTHTSSQSYMVSV